MDSIIEFEKGITSNEVTPEKKRKYKISRWAKENIPENTIQTLREQFDLCVSDPASYLIPELNNLVIFVDTVNASAALTASIPVLLGGPGASPLTPQ